MPGGGCSVTRRQFSSSLLSPQSFCWLQTSEPRYKHLPLVQVNLHSEKVQGKRAVINASVRLLSYFFLPHLHAMTVWELSLPGDPRKPNSEKGSLSKDLPSRKCTGQCPRGTCHTLLPARLYPTKWVTQVLSSHDLPAKVIAMRLLFSLKKPVAFFHASASSTEATAEFGSSGLVKAGTYIFNLSLDDVKLWPKYLTSP